VGWQVQGFAHVLKRLAQSFRVIVFDKRGQGLSDSFEGVPTLEQRMDDVRDVMQAAGSHKAVLFAWSEGGAMAVHRDLSDGGGEAGSVRLDGAFYQDARLPASPDTRADVGADRRHLG
jgi:pimeloyl-ACP methyl ester carboxylesterase